MKETKESNLHSQTIIHETWNPIHFRFDYFFEFAFRTRGQYVDFRRDWKQNYAALSQAIRGLKALIKATMRKREYAGTQQVELCRLKSDATLQLMMRRSSKQEANRQYVVARQTPL
jgi:hypothetical protein